MTANQYFKWNNQPKTNGRDGGEKDKEIQQGGEHGGSVIPLFWWQKSLEGCRIIK